MSPMADPLPPGRPKTSGVRHELPLIATVLGTAVVFGVLVSLLPGIGRTTPEEAAGAVQYRKAQAAEDKDPKKALELYGAIGPETGEWYDRARIQMARIRAEEASKPPQPSAEEQTDYDSLLEAWKRYAGDYDELIRRSEAFVMAHPRGELRPKVEERIALARQGRASRRLQDAEETELAVARLLERRDFGGALEAIEKASGRLRAELDVWPRLATKRDAIIADARKHYFRQLDEANRLVKEGNRDEARRLWYSAIRSFGDGKVPELADLHHAAVLRSEEIKP